MVESLDPRAQLNKTKQITANKLREDLISMETHKFNVILETIFEKWILSKQFKLKRETKVSYFKSKSKLTINNNIIPALNKTTEGLVDRIGEWLDEGSGWSINAIKSHNLNVVRYRAHEGRPYTERPIELQNPMEGLINLKNKDNGCSRWCHNKTFK